MQLSYDTVRAILESRLGDDFQHAHEYGEPGYSTGGDGSTPIIILGNYWCRCGKNPHAGQPKGWNYAADSVVEPGDLHDHAAHHPRIWAQMESQGVEFEWNDEWVIDYDADKAYRTSGDSYQWKPSAIYTEGGDLLTPDSDIDEWIAWAANEPTRCITIRVDLDDAGFELVNRDHSYESGWHPGQNDDPVKILEREQRYHPDDTFVFTLDENSQFYSGFSLWRRPAHDMEEA